MKKRFLLPFLLLLTQFTFAQSFTKETLYGKWEVDTILFEKEGLDATYKQAMEMLMGVFSKATIQFSEDKKCTIQFAKELPALIKDFKMLENTYWNYSSTNGYIELGANPGETDLLRLQPIYKNGELTLRLDDTILELKMKKIN